MKPNGKSRSECKRNSISQIERFFEEVWNERRIETIDELMSPNCVSHFEHEKIIGRKNWKGMFYDTMLKAIPDLSVEVKDNISDRGIVVSRWEAKGVFSDELFGISPSNKQIEFSGISWTSIIDGKLVEVWNNWDMSYLFRQLHEEIKTLKGIIPICALCKKIRNKKGYWDKVEKYIQEHSNAIFSHGICDDCCEKHYGDWNLK